MYAAVWCASMIALGNQRRFLSGREWPACAPLGATSAEELKWLITHRVHACLSHLRLVQFVSRTVPACELRFARAGGESVVARMSKFI